MIAQSISSSDVMLHEQFVQYGRNAKEWMRKCALLLPEIDRQLIWQKKGFGSLVEYAGKLAGMSRHAVEDALRILKKIEDKPELQKIVEERGVNAVRPVVAIATKETAEFWAGKSKTMSKNTLEVYVKEYRKKGADFQSNLNSRTSTPIKVEMQITMTLNAEIAEELEKLKGQNDWNDLMEELLKLRKQKIDQEKPKPKETSSRHIPEEIKKFVLQKTNGQCAYPKCTKPYKILHHTQRWALENIHDPDQLVALCCAHERLAHHGLIKNEEQLPENWDILEKPTWWHPKRMVDQVVMEYRKK